MSYLLKPIDMIKNEISNIRMAKVNDAEAIARVHILSWQKMYKEFIPEDILQNLSTQERIKVWNELIKEGVKILVIEVDEQVVGFASICAFRDLHTDGSMGEISAIYLHPDYWRQGLGRKLCGAAIDALANLGYRKISLWVLEANMQARGFYESLGFIATPSTKLEEFYEGGALLKEMLYVKVLC